MKRLFFSWLSLLVLLLAACQPIRLESELPPPTSDSTTATITDSAEITDTTNITATTTTTGSSEITETTEVTGTTTSTPTTSTGTTASTPSTPSTSSSAISESAAECPALTDQALDLSILAEWEEGEQRHYIVSGQRVDSADGDEAVTLSVTSSVTVTVLEVNDDGYVLEWDYGQAELGEVDVELPDPIATIFETPLQLRTTYATDDTGAYVELVNLEDLQAQIEPIFDQFFDALAEMEEEPNPEAIEAARGMVDQLIENPANFEALFVRDIQLFHTLHGFYFQSAEPMVLPDVRPNLLGGSPIPSELTITPTHYDEELGCLHVGFENIADSVAARNSILEALQEQAEQMGVPGPSDADLPEELELVDDIRFEFDLISGWPIAIYLERTTDFGPQGRVETTEIVLVEPETE
jgi:hypothetical protein